MEKINIFWFRRDLRLHDNAGLYHALKAGLPVQPIFIFDTEILDQLEEKKDRRVEFIYNCLKDLAKQLFNYNSSIKVYYGKPVEVFSKILTENKIARVYINHDYEPYALERDTAIAKLLQDHGATIQSFKDQVIFEKDEVLKGDKKPYTVFTPYSRTWKSLQADFHLKPYPTEKYFSNFNQSDQAAIITLEAMGFETTGNPYPPASVSSDLLEHYQSQRNFPGTPGTSRLGIHLRF
ncbi:MAG: deoxyribodipyrimidine photo-lyase, partial [Ferruginibacter sp.]